MSVPDPELLPSTQTKKQNKPKLSSALINPNKRPVTHFVTGTQ